MYSVKFKILTIFVFLFFAKLCYGQEILSLDLKGCIERVVRFHPELGEYKKDIEIYKAKLSQAEGATLPKIEIMSFVGPSPKAEKEAISPIINTEIKSTTINGIFGMIGIQLVQPIYTFGKLSGYRTAAEGGIKVSEAEIQKKRSELIFKIKELYWSLALLRDLKGLAVEIRDELEKAIKKTEEDLKREIPSTDELTLYKLKTYLGEVKRNLNELDKNEGVIIEALKFMTGIPLSQKINVITPPLSYEEAYINKDEMINKAFSLRPEIVQIKEGIKAKQALLDIEKSNLYPQVFALLKGNFSAATNRDRIHNPYISDPLNSSYFALLLGMSFTIDFGITKGKIKEAKLEYEKILEKKKLAEQGIPVQITKAYLEYLEATKTAKDLEEAFKNAKKWFIAADANLDMGIGEIKDLADAVLAYANTRINYLKALFNQKIAIANLMHASGLDKEEREVN